MLLRFFDQLFGDLYAYYEVSLVTKMKVLQCNIIRQVSQNNYVSFYQHYLTHKNDSESISPASCYWQHLLTNSVLIELVKPKSIVLRKNAISLII